MLYLSLKNPIKKSDLYEAGLCHFQCMKELHPAKTVAHAHGHHHRSAVFSAAPTVVCCRAGHSLLLLLRCKYRKFFRKSSFSAGILFCVKNGLFCHVNERNFVVEKIILIFVAKTECITLLENYDMKKLCTALMAVAVVASSCQKDLGGSPDSPVVPGAVPADFD